MGTRWEVEGENFAYILNVDETSTPEEIEAEIEYWMNEIFLYDPPDPYRASLLKAVRWMNEQLG